jgi:hypothetical protein
VLAVCAAQSNVEVTRKAAKTALGKFRMVSPVGVSIAGSRRGVQNTKVFQETIKGKWNRVSGTMTQGLAAPQVLIP